MTPDAYARPLPPTVVAPPPAHCPHGRLLTPPGAAYDHRTECRVCWLVARGLRRPDGAPLPPDPPPGPGAELKAMFIALGLPADGCGGCALLARRMDEWGVAGCREPAHRDEALVRLRARAKGLKWRATLKAAVATARAEPGLCAEVVRTGDPAAVFYDEAVRRAEAKGGSGAGVKSPDPADVLPDGPHPADPAGRTP